VRANHTPGNVLAKAQVANVTRTKLAREPAIEDLVPADQALLTAAIGPIKEHSLGYGGYGLTVDAVMTLGDRCEKLGLAVAAGGDATRARLLIRILGNRLNQHGVSDSDLCSLVKFIIETLKADVNAADSAGITPLHIAAVREVSSPLVVPLLLKYGANKDARTLEGHTPFGKWSEGWQSSCDFRKTFGLDDTHHNVTMDPARLALANKSFELDVEKMRLLIPDGVLAHLTDGLMSPRMYRRVRMQAEIMADMASDEIGFTGFVNNEPMSRDDVEVSGFDHVPCEVTGDEVFKSFAEGFAQCLAAMRNVLDSGKLPVPQLVVHELRSHSSFDARYTSHYFDRGGKVEFVIDAVLAAAKSACEDGSYEEEQGLWEEGEEPSLVVPELDDNFDLIRACLLGPHYKRGPLREQ
jgi:hypothetical protein